MSNWSSVSAPDRLTAWPPRITIAPHTPSACCVLLLLSPTTCRSLKWLDISGHLMSLLGICSFMLTVMSRARARPFHVTACCLMVASLVQLYVIQARPAQYKAWRHRWAVFNRLSRILLLLLPVLNGKRDVISELLPRYHHAQQVGTLLAYVCVVPLTQFYTSLCFVLPVSATLLSQLVGVGLTAMLVWQSHGPLSASPGMQQLADRVCGTIRGAFELFLYVTVDQGTLPGVPAAGMDAFGLPSRCTGHATFKQLLLFANLNITYFLPVFVTFVVELHHKRQFWQTRRVQLAVQPSPLMPLPGHFISSHCIVLCFAQLLLWFLAEALTPLLSS